MGNWRTGDPEESGSFLDDFGEWIDTPEGQQSIEAHDLVFDTQENAGVNSRQRKIVWDDGQRPSIEQSVACIHPGHPDTPFGHIEINVVGWLERRAPETGSECEFEKLDELIEPLLNEQVTTCQKNS